MRTRIAVMAVLTLLASAACGDTTDGVDETPEPAGACTADQPDCVDSPDECEPGPACDPGVVDGEPCEPGPACDPGPVDGPIIGDDGSVQDSIDEAHGLLGRDESEVPDGVRIGRRGQEVFALTEDYVLGRMTVALDDTDGSGFRVVAVTVELPDGPQTFELTPG